jgi:hypothetical protein
VVKGIVNYLLAEENNKEEHENEDGPRVSLIK